MSDLRIEQHGSLGVITLNRPQSLNALTTDMCRGMLTTLLQWRNDRSVRQVVVAGAGDRGLCAGGDIVAIYRDIKNREGSTDEFWRIEYQLNALIDEYPKPYIALMDGIVLGGGIGISAHGSHRVVTERSKCGMPEVGIGFFPDVGGTHLLARAPRAAGRYAALTGLGVGAADAIHLGLADVYVESSRLPALRQALTEQPVDEVLPLFRGDAPKGILTEPWIQAFDHGELVRIHRALRQSGDPDALKADEALRRACPSAVHLVNRLIDGAGKNLRLDLVREFRAAINRLDDPDFAEGIRAAVIDKDRSPQWVRSLPGLDPEQRTAAHFAPLPGGDLAFDLIAEFAADNEGAR